MLLSYLPVSCKESLQNQEDAYVHVICLCERKLIEREMVLLCFIMITFVRGEEWFNNSGLLS